MTYDSRYIHRIISAPYVILGPYPKYPLTVLVVPGRFVSGWGYKTLFMTLGALVTLFWWIVERLPVV